MGNVKKQESRNMVFEGESGNTCVDGIYWERVKLSPEEGGGHDVHLEPARVSSGYPGAIMLEYGRMEPFCNLSGRFLPFLDHNDEGDRRTAYNLVPRKGE